MQPSSRKTDGGSLFPVGSSVWLCDLSDHLPASATLDGFDATAAKFPHPESLPANVTLRVLDATQPPPPELRGRYDVVNVRLVLAVVQDADPSPVLRHCMDLLSRFPNFS